MCCFMNSSCGNTVGIFFKVSVIFIIAGAIGNLIDRIAYGGVVDFLTIEIGNFTPFAVFNLADTFLSIGLILLI